MVRSFVAACGVPSSIRASVRRTFVRGGRPCGFPSVRFGQFYADCLHKRVIYVMCTCRGSAT